MTESLTADDITAVTLSRGPCYGPCPVYRVTFTTTGRATYEGEEFVERVGRYWGTVDPERVADLIQIMLQLGFDALEPEYLPPATDMPVHELTVWSGRHPRRVADYGSAPPAFWAMAALVDALVEEVDWEPVTSGAPPTDDGPDEAGDPERATHRGAAEPPTGEPQTDDDQRIGDPGRVADPNPLQRRADGKVYCCVTLGWVDVATFIEHHWDTSRPYDEYLSERASAWDGIEPGK